MPQCRNLTPDAIAKGRVSSVMARAKYARKAYADLQPILADESMALQAIVVA